jgi:molybdenum cofactor cytidylyltransferase
MSSGRTFGLIPAAGHSTRMGRSKLALPLGNQQVLQRVIAMLRQAGIEDVLVVVGPAGEELEPLAKSAGAQVLRLPVDTPDMRATIEQGLRWLQEHFQPDKDDNWLLLPADHPTLDADVVRTLLQARIVSPAATIFVPTFAGRRGHPALIAWSHVPGIHALPSGLGLNQYLREQTLQTQEVPVGSSDILCDLDTPEDYQRLLRTWEGKKH